MMARYATAILTFLLFLFVCPVGSPNAGSVAARFVDLDGDGINDNLTDSNNDGIPDEFSGGRSGETPFLAAGGTQIAGMFDAVEVKSADLLAGLSRQERFKLRQSTVRDLGTFRGGFYAGEDFGPGNGIAAGASGKVCVGGICF
jgi:hypothetical protein